MVRHRFASVADIVPHDASARDLHGRDGWRGDRRRGGRGAGGLTFSRDIAPIMFTRCVSWHRPGAVAFSLLTYDK
jgi:hypothetical protein